MLVLASRAQLDALPGKDELPHRAMVTDPYFVEGLHEGLRVLVRNDSDGMPSGASADHAEDDVLANEEQVTFNLVVEFVRDIHTADVIRAWLSPLTANFACLNDFWNKLQDSFRNSCTIQESLHNMF